MPDPSAPTARAASRSKPTRSRRGAVARQGRGPTDQEVAILYGFRPVAAALANPRRRILRLLATENGAARLSDELPGPLPLAPTIVRSDAISRLVEPDAVHQGLYVEAEPLESHDLDAFGEGSLLLALDQITDPHNVGAITRSAAAFGVDAIVTTARHSPGATGVLAKAASGGLEHVPFVIVRNLAEALIELGERGFRRVGLDSAGESALASAVTAGPLVLVLGAEGKGLRQRTRDTCDAVVRLEVPGAIGSLNVSNAAAIALYVVASSRR